MERSKVEEMLLNPGFDYLQPYFYTNRYALRCELGIGSDSDEYMRNAHLRAEQIYEILFPSGADAIAFNYWMYDWSDSGNAEEEQFDSPAEAAEIIENRIWSEMRALRFLSENLMKYRHVCVRGLKTYTEPDDPEYETMRRNRIICYSDGLGFDDIALINGQIDSENNSEVSLVSLKNECIMSVYDDRGCDVVFATYEKMKAFYPALKPFFLPYDLEEMERRFRKDYKV